MKNKRFLLESLKRTLGVSAWIFIVFTAIRDLSRGGETIFEHYDFSKMTLGVLAIGLGYGLPAMVYQSRKLSHYMKMWIHMGIGGLVTLATGFLVGWFPRGDALRIILWFAATQIVGWGLWAFSYFRNRKQAQEMNEKIREMNH